MEQKELDKIIKLHEKWVVGNRDGKRADLSKADLSYADLEYANLSDANLIGANLSNANLNNANLVAANLSDDNLIAANLSNSNLRDTDLSYADLSNSNLRDTDLSYADLSEATLNWVNWHETRGLKVYEAQLNSSRKNAQLAYIPSLNLATTGCWQNTWEATKKRVKDVYKESNPNIYKKYQLAFQYIENQMVEDKKDEK